MEFGIQLANLEPAKIRDLSQAAEGLGFDYVLFPDHIVVEGPERQYDPHALAWDMVAMAAYAAAGRFDEAVVSARSALDLLGGRGAGSSWSELNERYALYQQRQPYLDAQGRGPVRAGP